MKKIFYFANIILMLVCISCVNTDTNSNSNTCFADSTSDVLDEPKVVNTIKIPLTFDPTIPLSDKIKQANLRDMVIEKYNSFKNVKNRRKHPPVLDYRTHDGVIDLTQGGPLSYDEMWELSEREGSHTLSDYFYDAAYKDRWILEKSLSTRPKEYKIVESTSNLAKVYFIQDFTGFVRDNYEYCDKILQGVQKIETENKLNEVQEHQKLYE